MYIHTYMYVQTLVDVLGRDKYVLQTYHKYIDIHTYTHTHTHTHIHTHLVQVIEH